MCSRVCVRVCARVQVTKRSWNEREEEGEKKPDKITWEILWDGWQEGREGKNEPQKNLEREVASVTYIQTHTKREKSHKCVSDTEQVWNKSIKLDNSRTVWHFPFFFVYNSASASIKLKSFFFLKSCRKQNGVKDEEGGIKLLLTGKTKSDTEKSRKRRVWM